MLGKFLIFIFCEFNKAYKLFDSLKIEFFDKSIALFGQLALIFSKLSKYVCEIKYIYFL